MRGDLIEVYSFLTRGRGGIGADLFSLMTNDRIQLACEGPCEVNGVSLGIRAAVCRWLPQVLAEVSDQEQAADLGSWHHRICQVGRDP